MVPVVLDRRSRERGGSPPEAAILANPRRAAWIQCFKRRGAFVRVHGAASLRWRCGLSWQATASAACTMNC